jgi:ligand-binding SRPBCC domain-containing protein
MTKIELTTLINAPVERCFDLSLDVNLHMLSTSHTKEFVLKGRQEGLFEEGETVTWRAKHFGIWQNLTGKISEVKRPYFFKDEMLEGAFKSLKHLHSYTFENGITTMKDVLEYETPYGIFGWLFDILILKRYMTSFLKKRNEFIKSEAEKI